MNVVYDRSVTMVHRRETSQTGIALIDRLLLERLRPYLGESAIGKALDKQAEEIPSHATIYPKNAIESRHYPPQKVTVCPECDTIRAYPATTEPEYLLRYDVDGLQCFQDRIGSIYVSGDVAAKLKIDDLKPLYLQEIDVLDRPRDGLKFPSDPPWVEGIDATVPWNPTGAGGPI